MHKYWIPFWYREICSDHWGGIVRGPRRRLPEVMVHSLGWDWLRTWMPPELTEWWDRRFKIKEGLFYSGMPGWFFCICLRFPKISQMDFPNPSLCWMGFRWEKKFWVQRGIGQAWQRVAGLFFFGCFRGDKLWGRSLPFFQNFVVLDPKLF